MSITEKVKNMLLEHRWLIMQNEVLHEDSLATVDALDDYLFHTRDYEGVLAVLLGNTSWVTSLMLLIGHDPAIPLDNAFLANQLTETGIALVVNDGIPVGSRQSYEKIARFLGPHRAPVLSRECTRFCYRFNIQKYDGTTWYIEGYPGEELPYYQIDLSENHLHWFGDENQKLRLAYHKRKGKSEIVEGFTTRLGTRQVPYIVYRHTNKVFS